MVLLVTDDVDDDDWALAVALETDLVGDGDEADLEEDMALVDAALRSCWEGFSTLEDTKDDDGVDKARIFDWTISMTSFESRFVELDWISFML